MYWRERKKEKKKPSKTLHLISIRHVQQPSTSTHTTIRSCRVSLKLWSDNVNWNSCITNSQRSEPSVGLIAQLVEHCTDIREVMGSNRVEAWKFFKLWFVSCSTMLKLCIKLRWSIMPSYLSSRFKYSKNKSTKMSYAVGKLYEFINCGWKLSVSHRKPCLMLRFPFSPIWNV